MISCAWHNFFLIPLVGPKSQGIKGFWSMLPYNQRKVLYQCKKTFVNCKNDICIVSQAPSSLFSLSFFALTCAQSFKAVLCSVVRTVVWTLPLCKSYKQKQSLWCQVVTFDVLLYCTAFFSLFQLPPLLSGLASRARMPMATSSPQPLMTPYRCQVCSLERVTKDRTIGHWPSFTTSMLIPCTIGTLPPLDLHHASLRMSRRS